MKISELAIANDLVCRRAELAASFAALERGDIMVSVGGGTIDGPGMSEVRALLKSQLEHDLALNEQRLAELNIEIDDADASAGLPPFRLEAKARLVPTR